MTLSFPILGMLLSCECLLHCPPSQQKMMTDGGPVASQPQAYMTSEIVSTVFAPKVITQPCEAKMLPLRSCGAHNIASSPTR